MLAVLPDGWVLELKQLRYSQQSIDESDIAAVVRVMRSDWLTQGPEVERFEQALCTYTGARYCVAVSSGTAALHLALMVAAEKHARHRVQTSPLSFVATANAALMAGLGVVFHDVDAATGNASLDGFVDCISVPVHFAGRAAPIPLNGVVVEDACHALGALDFDGCSRVGSCAHSLGTCFSFHPVKPICTGEGGAVTCNDQGFADEVRMLRSHGRDANGRMVKLGYNYRMAEMQAALGTSQLQRCDEMRERRHRLAMAYLSRFFDSPPADLHIYAAQSDEQKHAHHLFPVRIKNGRRDEVKAALNAEGIGAQIHYSPPIHLQPYYRERFGYKGGEFPEAEAWSREVLSLPLHSRMTEADVERVVQALREALA